MIRHADPDYQNDSLTSLGEEQARRLALYLRLETFTHIYTSPLGRAQKTMQPGLERCRTAPQILHWLAELDGRIEDGRWAWNLTSYDHATDDKLAARIEETMGPRRDRLIQHWYDWLQAFGYVHNGHVYHVSGKEQRDARVAMFAHAGLITTLLCGIFNWPIAKTYEHIEYQTTGITHLHFQHRGKHASLRALSINSRPHLEEC